MAESEAQKQSELQTVRDTVESIWVAIVLAFVLRAFLVEAFVIPTGSMAPRLYGEHWMLQCPACQWQYAYGLQSGQQLPIGATCPTCNFEYPYGRGDASRLRSGDRVLVLKYLYQFTEPEPWDVVVFKNPQDNHQNYIKRLIAVPGETVEIVHGDIYVKSEGDETFHIRRKPRRVQEVMWQIIHAGDYPPDAGLFERYNQQRGGQSLTSQWFPFWRPDPGQVEHWEGLDEVPVSGGMAAHRVGRGVEFLGSDQPVALRFDADRRNFLPNYGYNHSDASKNPNIDSERDVISDLRLAVSYAPSEADSELILHLSSFDHRFRARIRAGGQVALEHQQIGYAGQPDTPWEVWDETSVSALTGRISRVALTHVDYRATVWVDGKAVARSSEAQYDADYQQVKDRVKIQERINELSRRLNAFGADAQELRRRQSILRAQRDAWFKDPPEVRILAGGGACRLRHLQLQRDVYYTNSSLPSMEARHPLLTYAAKVFETDQDLRARLEQNRQIPNGWGVMDHPLALDDHPGKHDLDEFYVLGDNSPQSHDSRSWVMASPTLRLFDDQGRSRYKLGTVPRYNLLGRAMFVYWPAGFAIPKLNVPLIPNVGRMRFIK